MFLIGGWPFSWSRPSGQPGSCRRGSAVRLLPSCACNWRVGKNNGAVILTLSCASCRTNQPKVLGNADLGSIGQALLVLQAPGDAEAAGPRTIPGETRLRRLEQGGLREGRGRQLLGARTESGTFPMQAPWARPQLHGPTLCKGRPGNAAQPCSRNEEDRFGHH